MGLLACAAMVLLGGPAKAMFEQVLQAVLPASQAGGQPRLQRPAKSN